MLERGRWHASTDLAFGILHRLSARKAARNLARAVNTGSGGNLRPGPAYLALASRSTPSALAAVVHGIDALEDRDFTVVGSSGRGAS